MKEYTARELIADIRRKAKSLPQGLDCKILVGDIENNHSEASHLQIESDMAKGAVVVYCDPDEVS